MKYHVLIGLATMALVSLSSCNKDDDPPTVFERKGLPMNGTQEVPAKTVPGSGTLDVKYDKNTKMLTVYAIWSGLTADPAAAHIHGTAPAGQNAGVKVDFHDEVMTASGTFTRTITVDNIAVKEDSLLAGFYYFNIHTPQNPGGEIRGQIEF